MNILMIGGGPLPFFLARSFLAKGHRVTVVNRDSEECRKMARMLKALVINGDGSDPGVLREAGADKADVLLAATSHDADNLAACQAARHAFEVPRVLALVHDPEHEAAFRELGVPGVFSITRVLTDMIERRVATTAVINLLPVFGGSVQLAEVVLPEGSPAVGQTLLELNLPQNTLVAAVQRGDEAVVPHGGTVLHAGDRLVVMSSAAGRDEVLARLTGLEDQAE